MRIVSLQPYLTDVLSSFGVETQLVGISHKCIVSENPGRIVIVTEPAEDATKAVDDDHERLAQGLALNSVKVSALIDARPDVIVTSCVDKDSTSFISWAELYLTRLCGKNVLIKSFSIERLAEMYDTFEALAILIGKGRLGRDLAQRTKAQTQDWAKNFYDRLRNKKVTVLSSVKPLSLATGLIPDLIQAITGQPQVRTKEQLLAPLTWSEIVAFRPDVIIVAPCGATLEESLRSLKELEAAPEWEDIPAVKRGEVIFYEGVELYQPGPRFIKGVAVMVSAVAGLDSGYITKKDEFYRLRFVELHRHRFMC